MLFIIDYQHNMILGAEQNIITCLELSAAAMSNKHHNNKLVYHTYWVCVSQYKVNYHCNNVTVVDVR